jgi:hypothetical protein
VLNFWKDRSMRSLAYFGFLQRIKINAPAERILREIRQRTGG